MAGRPKTKSTIIDEAIVDKTAVATVNKVEENKKEEATTVIKEMPLVDNEEIEIISLIPHVTYKDGKTNDVYEWDEIGHTELMTVETIKNMWRNYKSYFRNMWLKPNDNRIIKLLGLAKTYEKYEFVMDESNYTRGNIDKIIDILTQSSTSNGLKIAVCDKVKYCVANGIITDIGVIRILEKHLNLDLISVF